MIKLLKTFRIIAIVITVLLAIACAIFYPEMFKDRFYWSKNLTHKQLKQKQNFELEIDRELRRDLQATIVFICKDNDKKRIDFFFKKLLHLNYEIHILEKKTTKTIFSDTIVNPKLNSYGYIDNNKRNFNFNLCKFYLDKGVYEISLHCLKDNIILDDIDIKFEILYTRSGK